MSLRDKINYSIDLIKRGEKLALSMNDEGYFVAFSGGKDSQVLLELVKMAGVKYKAYYSVTTNDPPENVYFIRQNYPDVIWLHPESNFFTIVEKKGLPTMQMRFCCSLLKEQVGIGRVVLTGVRAEESQKRAKYNEVVVYSNRKEHRDRKKREIKEIEENQHRCIKGKDKLMIYPILKWSEKDIWDFIAQYNLPVNPCYKQSGRVGCMFCPFSNKTQINYYELKYPKFLQILLKHLDIFLQKKKDETFFKNGYDYYTLWKSKKSIKKYLAEKKQLELF